MEIENDPERRPYSVLTSDEVKEKMNKQINELFEIFGVSRSDATVLLMHLKWDWVRVLERLSDDKENLLTESGLKPIITEPNRDLSLSDSVQSDSSGDANSFKPCHYEFADNDDNEEDDDMWEISCGICFKTGDLITTPICSHKFCKTCWRNHLLNSIDEKETKISCADPKCIAAVGPDTIKKLGHSKDLNNIYEKYILVSYLEGNSNELQLCPATDCDYAIEFHNGLESNDEFSLNVVCLCGHTFCWKCKLESHRPVTCNNAFDWLSKELTALHETSSRSWIEMNTKPCPHCHVPVFHDGRESIFGHIITCACRSSFCWKCLRSQEAHAVDRELCVEVEIERIEEGGAAISSIGRWEAAKTTMEEAKADLKSFENYMIRKPGLMKEKDIKTVTEGLMLILQCRQFLKWSCVYDHLHTEYDLSKKEYLRFLQDKAAEALCNYLKTLLDETEKLLSGKKEGDEMTYQELSNFRLNLATATSDIGNYFYHFVKTLKDGFVDVEVRSYDGVAGPLWFCDRCTYGNRWIHKACKMCCDPNAPVPDAMEDELSDLSLNN